MGKATYDCARCGNPFEAREADRKRGWARFCSKSCKAKRQTARTGIGRNGAQVCIGDNQRRSQGGWITPDGELFDRHGVSEGFLMFGGDLAAGGYGDAGPDDPFGSDKL